jgi:hypothetical protein
MTILAADGSIALHACAARGCTATIHGELLMCRKHWKLVPGCARHDAIRAYRSGADMRNAVELVDRIEHPTPLDRALKGLAP